MVDPGEKEGNVVATVSGLEVGRSMSLDNGDYKTLPALSQGKIRALGL